MRTVKFRGKQIGSNQWVYGSLIQSENGQCYIFKGHSMPSFSLYSEEFVEVIPETVGQFIGQLDKNKREIYEKDTVRHIDGKTGLVEWFEDICGFNTGSSVFIYDTENGVDYEKIEIVDKYNQMPF